MNPQSNFGLNYIEESEVNLITMNNTQVSSQKIGEFQLSNNINFQNMKNTEFIDHQNFALGGNK
jgi:hypothetical protein